MDSINFAHASKARQLQQFFQQQGRIYIVVDATREDCILPEHLKNDPALNLVLNVRMPQPIHIRADGLRSRFSFAGKAFDCHIPLDAIWAAHVPGGNLEDGLLWQEAMPALVRSVLEMTMLEEAHPLPEEDVPATEEKTPHSPRLRIVK